MPEHNSPRPTFPGSVIERFFAAFCAIVALATVWVLPLSIAVQIGATEVFALVPAGILLFWAGRWFERHASRKRSTTPAA
ncbi:MAG: hypothetical protein JWQ18_1841 [Conexibacter sp.]|nr:hypothetical protein [Conexibacter sp.]